jgi:hypothetical protein
MWTSPPKTSDPSAPKRGNQLKRWFLLSVFSFLLLSKEIFEMKNPFKRRKVNANPDTDPIAITHEQDPSLAEDEMILYTTIETKDKK